MHRCASLKTHATSVRTRRQKPENASRRLVDSGFPNSCGAILSSLSESSVSISNQLSLCSDRHAIAPTRCLGLAPRAVCQLAQGLQCQHAQVAPVATIHLHPARCLGFPWAVRHCVQTLPIYLQAQVAPVAVLRCRLTRCLPLASLAVHRLSQALHSHIHAQVAFVAILHLCPARCLVRAPRALYRQVRAMVKLLCI